MLVGVFARLTVPSASRTPVSHYPIIREQSSSFARITVETSANRTPAHARLALPDHSGAVEFVREDYGGDERESHARTTVEVGKLDGQQKRIPASVVRIPFYDPDKTWPRS